MQIKPIYTVHCPNHNKTNFKGNQVKKSNFSATSSPELKKLMSKFCFLRMPELRKLIEGHEVYDL